MATSYASSSRQLGDSPKELLQVLRILNKEKEMKDEEPQLQHQHLHAQHQLHAQEEHKQQQLEECKRKGGQSQSRQLMELSQIELIYRAEGNANLVLALPQFKKVLRLPKISTNSKQMQPKQQTKYQETQHCQKSSPKHEPPQGQLKQQEETYQQEPNKTTGQQENQIDAAGILTMDHYVAYISIIRCLVGNEFVFEADVVAVPNPTDRQWINEHIKPYRPANRLDKEFGGHFGLLLPDATQLPAEFDILFSNLQKKCKSQSAMVATTTRTLQCSNSNSRSSSSSRRSWSSSRGTDKSCNKSNNIFGSDTFAIEIKPKQGWMLANDVNNLFDIKPKITQTTQPPSLRETKTVLKAAVATTMPAATEAKALKTSTDTARFTSTQNEPSQTIVAATSTSTTTTATPPPKTATETIKIAQARSKRTSQTETKPSRRCSDNMRSTTTTPRDDTISHPLYDEVDTRCRYCCMQFLKVKQQKILKRNQYCPIDLFSGSPKRMINAIEALFESPQNNLRIFRNGRLFFDDQISSNIKLHDFFSSDKLQLIKHLLVTCLLREYENKEYAAKNEEKGQIDKDTKQELLSSAASTADVGPAQGAECGQNLGGSAASDGQPHSSVTSCKEQTVYTMPKTIAATNSTNAEAEVTKVKSTLTSAEPIVSIDNTLMSASDSNTRCPEQINEAEVTCLPKNCVLQKILHLQSLAKIHFQFMLDHEYADKVAKTYGIVCRMLEKYSKTHNELTLCQLSPEEQYILGATALDCSIMITFCEIENALGDETQDVNRSPYAVSLFGRTFITKVTLLDLDPKSDAHFSKYCRQTKEIAAAMKEP